MDYIELLPVLQPQTVLSEPCKIKLFRQFLGDEGQRHFDALRNDNFSTLEQALNKYNELWGDHPSTYTARYCFSKLQQNVGEDVNDFIARIQQALPDCRYNEIATNKIEEEMAIQCLITGIQSDVAREKLLSEAETTLTWEKACTIVRHQENITHQLTQFAHKSSPDTVQAVTQKKIPPAKPKTFEFTCYRCGNKHSSADDCRHRKTVCHQCGKVGHLARVCRTATKGQLSKTLREELVATAQETTSNSSECEYSFNEVNSTTTHDYSRPPPYYIQVEIEGQPVQMEIDTGASVSIVSAKTVKNLPRLANCRTTLKTYTGEAIPILGKCDVHVQLNGKKRILPVYVVADQCSNLFGRDWIKSFPNALDTVKLVTSSKSLESILSRHAVVFDGSLGKLKGWQANIKLEHNAQPRFIKARSLPYAMRSKVEDELKRLQQEGIIRPVQYCEWGTPIVPVCKPDGSIRICGDYKLTVNRFAALDRYPLPRVEDLYATLAGGQKFTKIDLSHAYSQIELDEPSRALTTITTHIGLFQYTRLPFGINSAPAIFQRTIDNLIKDIPFTCAYLDDILISGRTDDEHLQTLSIVLERLNEHGLKLKRSKCEFLRDSVCYLGYRLDSSGLHIVRDKIKPILEAPEPRNIIELRSFLGMLSHYRRFLPNISQVLEPLYTLLHKDTPWVWGHSQKRAFTSAKALLGSSSFLAHFDPKKPILIQCDASPSGVGAVLCHRMNDNSVKPVAFASRTLQPAEKNYSQLDREALAVIFAVKRFHAYIWGRPFKIYTDHKPLLALLGEAKEIQQFYSPRMQRWALLLSAYKYELHYVKGPSNIAADALSRLPLPTKVNCMDPPEVINLLQHLDTTPVKSKDIQRMTDQDPILSTVKRFILSGWPVAVSDELRPFLQRKHELSLYDGCVFWGSRIVIPQGARQYLLRELHDAHPGITRMKALARGYCWWPKIDQDIEDLLRTCEICQKYQRHNPPGPIHPWCWPDKPWQRIHADYFGPINGMMCLIIVDAYSKWIEVHPVTHANAEATINKMRSTFATFGIPETICTDNGAPFISEDFQKFLRNNGVRHVRSAPYHPASNGLAERAVQTVKQGIVKQSVGTLQMKLDRLLFAYRTTPTEATGRSPAELMFGRTLRTRLQLLFPSPRARVETRQEKLHAQSSGTKDHYYNQSDPVYARLPHETTWQPATVVASTGNTTTLKMSDGRIVCRHSDHVRPRTIELPDEKEQLSGNDQPPESQTTPPQDTNAPPSQDAPRRSQRTQKPVDRYGVTTYHVL